MANDTSTEVYDLLILVDATYSMVNYLESLKNSLPKVISISKLTNSFERIGLLAYRDYSEAHRKENGLVEWSGWYNHNDEIDGRDVIVTAEALIRKASNLEPIGGGDYPEATKTGLARAYELMREEATTIILLYTDAPPHCWAVAERQRGSNYHAEQAALSRGNSYGGSGRNFVDWVSACNHLRTGPRKVQVFCFLDESLERSVLDAGYYIYLSTMTRGACFYLTDAKPRSIAQTTVDVLLVWMGVEKAGTGNVWLPAKMARYKSGQDIKMIKDEKDVTANRYFGAGTGGTDLRPLNAMESTKLKDTLRTNLAQTCVSTDTLKMYLPKRKTPVQDFAKAYTTDDRYKKVVVQELKSIIESDVTSMSLNPIFGSLWRATCNDRENPAREELISAFGYHIERIADADEKTRMKNWLEGSYDYAAEILETLEAVPEHQRYPCVFLDPTIDFRPASKKGDKQDEDKEDESCPVTAFRRDELLEIGRSCDARILRRLGEVLTRITYAESDAELPAHVAATTNADVPRIPVALASSEYAWKFWKILLHVVLPGTMLSARPAVLLAALAIRIGLKPLFGPASAAMLCWRDKWNNLDVPETWNSSCIGLLLDADAEYRKQKGDGADEKTSLLDPSDRQLFSRLVAYKMAEKNLLTTLTAKVGWTPEKTLMPVGHVITCRGCGFPRSVTIMAQNTGNKCGLCVVTDWPAVAQKEKALNAHVTKADNENSAVTWVECSVRTCRAQYVCYNSFDLNVRPKCHYCRLQSNLPIDKRNGDPAPTLECRTCFNKVIWPYEWRAAAPVPFICVACFNGRKSIVPVDTNAEQLCKENGQGWLLQNSNGTLKEPFKRSLFHTISTAGPEAFLANVQILPTLDPQPVLTLRGKRIHNQASLIASLESWIRRRTSEKSPCSLCFSNIPNARLLPACRRRGCHQRICEGCLNSWYGLNAPGSVINTAALFCPFCRRPPAARTLAAYGMGIHAVGELRTAVDERGRWIHAWCYHCGKARRYMERECARGAPETLEQWTCEECNVSALERARIAEEEARRALDLAAQLEAEERAEAEANLRRAQRLRRELECPVKECPGCKTPTQKTDGCDHMTCSIPRCWTHWCWSCGKAFDQSLIYEHMQNEHGGLYAGGVGVGLDDEDDYD